jgi:hypothetical protein
LIGAICLPGFAIGGSWRYGVLANHRQALGPLLPHGKTPRGPLHPIGPLSARSRTIGQREEPHQRQLSTSHSKIVVSRLPEASVRPEGCGSNPRMPAGGWSNGFSRDWRSHRLKPVLQLIDRATIFAGEKKRLNEGLQPHR